MTDILDKHPRMGWVDLETTGLDPLHDRPIELGGYITNDDLEILDSISIVIHTPEAYREKCDPFVRDMHEKSGLWKEAFDSTVELADAAEEFRRFFLQIPEPGPLCGSSVGFDRRFMEVWTPLVLQSFTYRNLDVSSIKEAVKVFAPELSMPKLPDDQKPHRSLEDLDASVAELKYYRDNFFEPARHANG